MKNAQRLIGDTDDGSGLRPRIRAVEGDGIVLANGNEVAGLTIEVVSGAALVADNVTGANLHDLRIIRSGSSSISRWDRDQCDPVVKSGEFHTEPSVVRGCNALLEPRQKGAVVFMADGNDGSKVTEHSIRTTTIEDGTEYIEGRLWDHGIGVQLAGDATGTLTIEAVSISGTEHGISGRAYQNASLTLRVKDSSVEDLLRDGVVLSVGFICSGLPSAVWYDRDCTDRQWVPVSHAQVVLHAEGYRYADPQRRGLPDDASAIELIGYDQGSSEIEIHVRDSWLIGAAQSAVFNFNVFGHPARQVIDLGCRNPAPGGPSEFGEDRAACERAGYTSPGGNRIYGNAWGGTWSSRLVEVGLIGPGMMMAQGNYWGDIAPPDGVGDALGPCSRINLVDERLIRSVPDARCDLWHVPARTAPTGIDGRFHLITDPAG